VAAEKAVEEAKTAASELVLEAERQEKAKEEKRD
jgi:hypothetical protein